MIFWLDSMIAHLADSEAAPQLPRRYHLDMVVDSSDSPFWDMVYQGAQRRAEEKDAYVELMETQMGAPYRLNDQLNMAVAARVDGAFIVPDGTQAVAQAMADNAQSDQRVPLLAVMEDVEAQSRSGFVGVDPEEQGSRYGELIAQLAQERDITSAALLGASGEDSFSRDSLYESVKRAAGDLVPGQIMVSRVNHASIFNCKRDIRSQLLSEDAPDVLICPDYLLTLSACQVAVEQNLVGKITIMGSYASESILDYIQKGTLYGTVTVDPMELGGICVDKLIALSNGGEAGEDVLLELEKIDSTNVRRYKTLYAQMEGRP